jgi:flagellar basal-body rod protein FlgC
MSSISSLLSTSASGMSAQAARLRLVAENIANADTPGYRRKIAPFEASAEGSGVALGPVRLDSREGERIFDPAHPMAGPDGSYTGSNVDLLLEIADSREAGRSYEANLKMMNQARDMLSSALDTLLR